MTRTSLFGLILLSLIGAVAMSRAQTQQRGATIALPPLSSAHHHYYAQHPDEYRQFLQTLPRVSHKLTAGKNLQASGPPVAGTWTALTNPPGVNLMSPRLLTDGTVVAMTPCTSNWYKLTPDINGSYINGTWAQVASTVPDYAPRFFGSGVLPDGRLIIEGGEYNGAGCTGQIPDATQPNGTTQGAIYDPAANTWTPVSPPSGWSSIGGSAGAVIGGVYWQTSCCDSPSRMTFLADTNALTWAPLPADTGKFDPWGNESIGLPRSGPELLVVDAYTQTGTCGEGFQTRTMGVWTANAYTSPNMFASDCFGNAAGHSTYQTGPLVGLPDDTFIIFSGWTGSATNVSYSRYSAIGMVPWNAPAAMPTGYTMTAAPAVVLPSGNVLLAMQPGGLYPPPTHFWEFNPDPAVLSFTQVGDKSDAADFNAYQQNVLLLPNGQVLATTIDGPTVEIYTPLSGTYQSSWQPTVSSVPGCVAPSGTYAVSGSQFTGLDDGGFGKTVGAQTNYPLVQIVNNATGHVFYARTYGTSANATNFQVAAASEAGLSKLYVVANGIPSAAAAVTVASDCASLKTATHDFNGDGRSDIAWRDTGGNTSVWLMNGAAVSSSGGFGVVPTTWSLVGQRDFDGDGKADLLWRDTSGNTAIWFMNGASVSSSAGLGNIPTDWTVVATADFDGDGKGDILWQDTGGNLAMWLMNDATVSSSGGVGSVPTAVWSIVAVADFDGDGKADLLWRDTGGNLAMWFMNGAQVSSTAGVGNVPAVWSVAGTGDFNGDGKFDLLWHDTSGNTAIWFMNGAAVSSTGGLGNIPTAWTVQSVNAE